jgi:3-phenylpropionate/trans-cinnamate dioxygenase ferredoxin reductase component
VVSVIVIAGAGLGGLRAAESLRANGYHGPLTIIGDEAHPPYNRPPLSKEALEGGVDVAGLYFRQKASVQDVEWRLNTTVVSATPDSVSLADGSTLGFDGLVVATGIRPRHLDVPGPQPAVLRTATDAAELRAKLTTGASLLIVGAGFIGCEVAATARSLGCEVTVTAFDEEPMLLPLGHHLGAAMRRHHEEHGVRFDLGVGVERFTESGVVLADGRELSADIVMEAVGSVPNTEWLDGMPLDLTDGVLCDNNLQAAENIVAVGDVARFPNPLFDEIPRRIEHWNMPTETGKRAGKTLAAIIAGTQPPVEPFTPMPAFWSDQYTLSLQSYGQPSLGEPTLVDGEWTGDCIVEYRAGDQLMGVVGVNRTRDLTQYRNDIGQR